MSMTIMVPDALAAVENNLKAILTLAKIPFARLWRKSIAHSGTASVIYHKDMTGNSTSLFIFPLSRLLTG